MRKLLHLVRGLLELIREHRMYFLAPLFFTLAALSLLVFYVGPTVVITFIYAGI